MTPEMFIKKTLETKPEQIRHRGIEPHLGLMVLDATLLKRYAQEQLGHPLNWEDWLECKFRWCATHRAYDCQIVNEHSLNYFAPIALAHGYVYLLVERVTSGGRHA